MKLLKTVREKHRFSLRELGQAVGKSASYLGELERGTRKPTPETLASIAEKLGHREELFLEAGLLDPKIEEMLMERSFYSLLNRLTSMDKEKVAGFVRIAERLF